MKTPINFFNNTIFLFFCIQLIDMSNPKPANIDIENCVRIRNITGTLNLLKYGKYSTPVYNNIPRYEKPRVGLLDWILQTTINQPLVDHSSVPSLQYTWHLNGWQ